ncbi:MAG: hypothetical protein ACRDPF_39825, partial [Streptosporangiaceae bacterium]
PAPGASQGAIRQLAGGNTPRLRLSERDKAAGSIGGLRGPGAVRPTARREPQLKLGRPGQRSPVGLGAAFAPAGLGAGTARVRFGGRRREGVLGGSLLGGSRSVARGGWARLGSAGPGSSRLGSSRLGSSRLGSSRLGSSRLGMPRLGSSSMGRSLLGGSVFSRKSSSPLSRPAVFGRSAPLGLASPLRHRGNLAGGGLTGHAPRFSRGSSLTRLTSALRRSGGSKSPGRGWLRGASSRSASSRRGSSRRGSLGSGSLGSGSLGGGSLGSSSLGRRAFGGRRIGRNLGGRNLGGGGLGDGILGGGKLGGRGFGHAGSRLRMPRPKSRRRWRSGGYR